MRLDRDDLLRNAARSGPVFHWQTQALAAKMPGHSRSAGARIDDRRDLTLERGPAVLKTGRAWIDQHRGGDDVVRFFTPVNITRAEVDEAVEKMTRAFRPGRKQPVT